MTTEEALALLPDGGLIHTLTQNLIGADWPREKLVAVIRRPDVAAHATTGMPRALGHGLALVYVDDRGQRVLFVQTRAGAAG